MTDSPSITGALLSPQSDVVGEAAVILRSKETELRERWLLRSRSWRIEPGLGILTWQRTPESAGRAPYEFSEFWGFVRTASDGLAAFVRGRLFVHNASLMVSIISRFDPMQGAWTGTGEVDRSHARLHLASELRAIGEE